MSWKGTRKANRQKKELETLTDQEREIANIVGRHYAAVVKSKSRWANPLRGKKPEESKWWICFVKTARACLELEVDDPKQYVTAQFDRFNWKPGTYPFPSQLYSEHAQAYWIEHQGKLLEREHQKIMTKKAVMYDVDDREQRKLDSWAKRLGVSRRHVLREYPREFSESFLAKNGIGTDLRVLE